MTEDIQKSIEDIVRQELGNVTIDSVEVTPDLDFDGDRILRVKIVFSANTAFDVRRAKGLVRHLRPALADTTEDLFPMISFLSAADNRKLKSATG